MVDLKTSQADTLLSRDQLREVERFQAKFEELERQLHRCVDEFLSVLNRHYFNRENGYLKEQEDNLREIVTIQSKLEALASNMTAGATELKSRMLALQKNIHNQGGTSDTAAPQDTKQQVPEDTTAVQKPEKKQEAKTAPQKSTEPTGKKKLSKVEGLVVTGDAKLADSSESGGEISLKLIFEGLKLTDSANADALNQISSSLRKLLYDRKLVGYSKTSLVFGKNRTVDEVLQDLSPIFLSAKLQALMTTGSLIEPGSGDSLKLACNEKRELIYIIKR